MSHPLVTKDSILLQREKFARRLFLVIVLLAIVSAMTGLQREQVFVKEREAALDADRSVWMNQGERNPHSAAHFARYAFRPASPLGMLDPGTTDFAGLAIWMEAHYQDPAVFRRAEDVGELGRYTQLTPAFIFLVVAPLMVFLLLFGCVAGERQDGTLRQLLATGVSAQQFFYGKLASGLRTTLFSFSVVFITIAVASMLLSPAHVDFDAVIRLLLMYVSYAAYLLVFVAIAVAVSALFRTRQRAFLALMCIWALMTVIVPRFASDFSTALVPQADARESTSQLRAASYTLYEDEERRQSIRQQALDEYGVETVEELPFNFGAYELQMSEDLSEPEFDRFYRELDQRFARQEAVVRWFSVVSPTVPMLGLSRGLAGTDRIHQGTFAQAAEQHRREMVQLLNEDYMYNATNPDEVYMADAELWARFEDLHYEMPELKRVAGAFAIDALVLLAWALIAMVMAQRIVSRAVRGEVSTS